MIKTGMFPWLLTDTLYLTKQHCEAVSCHATSNSSPASSLILLIRYWEKKSEAVTSQWVRQCSVLLEQVLSLATQSDPEWWPGGRGPRSQCSQFLSSVSHTTLLHHQQSVITVLQQNLTFNTQLILVDNPWPLTPALLIQDTDQNLDKPSLKTSVIVSFVLKQRLIYVGQGESDYDYRSTHDHEC